MISRRDEFLSEKRARHAAELASEPKTVKFYDSHHSHNAQARRDRFGRLRTHMGLAPLDLTLFDKVKGVS